jgi:hypothetical protein
MRFFVSAALALTLITTTGCTSMNPKNYMTETPKFSIEEFFNGPIKAWGIIQDWRGNVVARFDVDMVGTWENGEGVLDEDFRYYSGKTQKRVWRIKPVGDGTYQGFADDIVGTASGQTFGNAMQWKYQMDVPVDGTTYRLTFDDWMWQMNDGVVINRSYLKKFGITVAELTLFMQKQDAK